jgi:hypothetical protein
MRNKNLSKKKNTLKVNLRANERKRIEDWSGGYFDHNPQHVNIKHTKWNQINQSKAFIEISVAYVSLFPPLSLLSFSHILPCLKTYDRKNNGWISNQIENRWKAHQFTQLKYVVTKKINRKELNIHKRNERILKEKVNSDKVIRG